MMILVTLKPTMLLVYTHILFFFLVSAHAMMIAFWFFYFSLS